MSDAGPPEEVDLELVEQGHGQGRDGGRAPEGNEGAHSGSRPHDPASERAEARRHHATYLGMAVVVLVLSALLSFEPTGDGAVTLGGSAWRLPPMCPLKSITGLSCPGCGLTRAFVLIGHGRLTEATALHRLAIPLFLVALYQIAYRPWMIRRAEVLPPPRLHAVHRLAGHALIAALIASWVVDVAMSRRV